MTNRIPNDRIREAARQVFGGAARYGREMAFTAADEAVVMAFIAIAA